jgi:hypothetical protein
MDCNDQNSYPDRVSVKFILLSTSNSRKEKNRMPRLYLFCSIVLSELIFGGIAGNEFLKMTVYENASWWRPAGRRIGGADFSKTYLEMIFSIQYT